MWMPLLEHQRFSVIFTIFVVALGAGARGHSLPQCAAAGEYCQTHWDCCSNSCMTYLYRCMRKAPSYSQFYIEPLHPFGDTSLDDLLDLNFGGNFGRQPAFQTPQLQNRFGIVENGPKPEKLPPPPTKMVIQNVPTDLLSILLQPQPNQQQQPHSPEVAQHETLPAAPVTAGERGSESGPVTSDAPCKPIGQKCFSNGECCTQRCHGYLHQCVT